MDMILLRHRGGSAFQMAVLFFIAAAGLSASDWPQFKRDAARSGNAEDEVVEFPLRRVTAARFRAPVYASPAVAGGRVYVQDARGLVACLDGASNRVLWTQEIGGVTNRSSPAIANGKVFVGSSAGHLAVLDAGTGAVLRRVPAGGGVITAPALANGHVYFSSFDGEVVKLDMEGVELWRAKVGPIGLTEFSVTGQDILIWAGLKPEETQDGQGPVAALVRVKDCGDRAEVETVSRVDGSAAGWPAIDALGTARETREGKGRVEAWLDTLRWPHKGYYLGKEQMIAPTRRGETFFARGGNSLHCISEGQALWIADRTQSDCPSGYHSHVVLCRNYCACGTADGRLVFYPLEAGPAGKTSGGAPPQRLVWVCGERRLGQPNVGICGTAAISDGRVWFGTEEGLLVGLGRGAEAELIQVRTQEANRTCSEGFSLKGKGSEWPTCGGDMSYSGVSDDQTIRPPMRIKWKTKVNGFGSYRNPIAAGGMVFADDGEGTVEALDAETGEIIWSSFHRNDQGYGLANSALTYSDGKLLVLRPDLETRRSPVAPGEAGAHGLYCLDARTGRVLWHKPRPVFSLASNNRAAGNVCLDGKVLAVSAARNGVAEAAAYDLDSGAEIWKQSTQVPDVLPHCATDPYVSQGCIGAGTWFCSISWGTSKYKSGAGPGQTKGVTLAIDPKTGKVLWRNSDCFVYFRGGIGFRKDTVVVFNGLANKAHALEPATGKLLWTTSGRGGWYLNPLTDLYLETHGSRGCASSYCGMNIFANGFWFGQRQDGGSKLTVSIHEEGKTKMQEVWRFIPTGRGCPAPAIAYGRLYYTTRGGGIVYCLEPVPQPDVQNGN